MWKGIGARAEQNRLSQGKVKDLVGVICIGFQNVLFWGGDFPFRGSAQGQIGKTAFKIDVRRAKGVNLIFRWFI
jgi:hypothetical protein